MNAMNAVNAENADRRQRKNAKREANSCHTNQRRYLRYQSPITDYRLRISEYRIIALSANSPYRPNVDCRNPTGCPRSTT
jgi:hypothetical protein